MPATTTDRLNGLTTSVAVKPPCVAVSSANLTLAGLQTVGSVALAQDDRVLVNGQTNQTLNGIYSADSGDWLRALDFNGARDAVQGTMVLVRNQFLQGALYELTSTNPITFGTSNIIFRLRDEPLAAGDVRRYGALGDGTDQTAQLQAALNSGVTDIYIPAGTYLLSAALTIPSGVNVRGAGDSTILQQTSGTPAHIFHLSAKQDITLRSMKWLPLNIGAQRAGLWADNSTNLRIVDINAESTDSNGMFLIDCDACVVDRLRFRGAPPAAMGSGYAVFMIGCKACRVSNSSAIRPGFGFVSASNEVASLASYGSVRTAPQSFGNAFIGCSVRESDGHAFDLNSVTGNLVSSCTAEDYSGSSTHLAFQIKHTNGDECRNNVVSNCTARNVPTGFGTQQGSNAVFIGCTALDCAKHGFQVNDTDRCQFMGCTVKNFVEFGIFINSSSSNNSFDGILMETATLTATAIGLEGAGSGSNNFDNIRVITGGLAKGIHIVAGATNNRFGPNVFLTDNLIDDASNASIWPLQVTTPEIAVTATGTVNGPYLHRGMIVANARINIAATITGTPQVQCGRLGANTDIAAPQVIAGSAGATVLLTKATQLLSTGAIVQGRVQVIGTAGSIAFQYEGLPRL